MIKINLYKTITRNNTLLDEVCPNDWEEGLKLFEPKEEEVAGRFDRNPAYGET